MDKNQAVTEFKKEERSEQQNICFWLIAITTKKR